MYLFLANFHSGSSYDQAFSFFAYICVITKFKAIVMELKNVVHAISMEKLILTICLCCTAKL